MRILIIQSEIANTISLFQLFKDAHLKQHKAIFFLEANVHTNYTVYSPALTKQPKTVIIAQTHQYKTPMLSTVMISNHRGQWNSNLMTSCPVMDNRPGTDESSFKTSHVSRLTLLYSDTCETSLIQSNERNECQNLKKAGNFRIRSCAFML